MADLGSTSYSETDASNNASPPNGWPEGMNPSDVNNSARANMGAEKRWWDRSNSTLTTAGTSTAYTLTYTVAAAAYYDGEQFSFIVNATSGATPTLNINGLGARQIRKFTAGAFANIGAGDLTANQPVVVRYNLSATTFDIVGGGGALPTLSPTTTQGDLIVRGASVDGRLALGTVGQLPRSNGTTLVYGDAITVKKQVITSTGTYTPSTGMLYCVIECVGGGGGGGGCAVPAANQFAGAGGGGAGSYSRLLATAATIGASKAVTIGAAGAAGTAGNNAGGNGGDTSVGVLCIGKGGTGGAGAAASSQTISLGGAGGVAGTGDIATPGQPGGSSSVGNLTGVVSGFGGSGLFGSGGIGQAVNGNTVAAAGAAGAGFGAGGSGAWSAANTATGTAGGAGTAGYVFILEYCNQ